MVVREFGRQGRRWLVAVAVAAAASGAQAATLPFEAELRVQLNGQAVTVSGSGTATLNASGGLGHLDALAFDGGTLATTGLVVPVTDPAAFPWAGLVLTAANGAGSFARSTGGAFQGVMPLLGLLRVCLFTPCAAPPANLSVPLSVVGAGGAATLAGAVQVTVLGAPWTTGPLSGAFPLPAIGQSATTMAQGFALGPGSAASSTASVGGQLQLVTPIVVSANVGADGPFIGFAALTLRFVPEPGSALLVGLGAIGLAGMRRWRGGWCKPGSGPHSEAER